MQQFAKTTKNAVSKADKTKARLINVAKRLVQEHGSDVVTLRDIAAAAKMKAGSIYYHFESRDEIIRAVLADGIGRATVAVTAAITAAGPQSTPIERFHAALRAHLKYTVEEHFSARLKAIRRLPKRLRDQHMSQEREYAAIFTGLLREAQKQGALRPGYNLSVVRMLAMGALTWVAEWYDPQGPMSLDDVADELMRILRDGVIKPA
ncbi:TetR/AcrR family transcriptional regulator [Vineibacter terrae]|nr:TetR/AcrR family transcriptional regulator [Vineibacter terrae]HEX2891286.1 TetR/AcrR family transcriptional regulator [Vineibacter terrae]